MNLLFLIIFAVILSSCDNDNNIDGAPDKVLPYEIYIKALNDFDNIDYFKNGVAKVEINGKYGLINHKGRVLVNCQYDHMGSFSHGKASVQQGGMFGVIDKRGKVLIPLKFEYIGSFSDGLAMIKKEGKYGFIDAKGVEIIPSIYDFAEIFSGEDYTPTPKIKHLAFVRKEGKYGFVNKKGREVIPCIYDEILVERGDSTKPYLTKRNGKMGLLGLDGEEILSCIYDEVRGQDDSGNFIVIKGDYLLSVNSKSKEEEVLKVNLSFNYEYKNSQFVKRSDNLTKVTSHTNNPISKSYVVPNGEQWTFIGQDFTTNRNSRDYHTVVYIVVTYGGEVWKYKTSSNSSGQVYVVTESFMGVATKTIPYGQLVLSSGSEFHIEIDSHSQPHSVRGNILFSVNDNMENTAKLTR